jgi:hypothetical protein
MSAHVPCGSAARAGTAAQRPFDPVRLQALQTPQLPDSQQTPSVQLPLAHSFERLQAVPFGFKPQAPPRQTFGTRQQLLPLHRYGLQATAAPATHAPALLHVEASVCVDPPQLRGEQTVPGA